MSKVRPDQFPNYPQVIYILILRLVLKKPFKTNHQQYVFNLLKETYKLLNKFKDIENLLNNNQELRLYLFIKDRNILD